MLPDFDKVRIDPRLLQEAAFLFGGDPRIKKRQDSRGSRSNGQNTPENLAIMELSR